MVNFMFSILVFLILGVHADALECIVGSQFQCTAHDATFFDECEQFEARNKTFTRQICVTHDKCALLASGLSFEDKYDLKFITAGCGSGTLDGCFDRDELLAMNPPHDQIGPQASLRTQWKDDFTGPSYEYHSLYTCVCADNCIDEEKLSEYRKNLGISNAREQLPGTSTEQPPDDASTAGLHLGGYFLISAVTVFSMVSRCML